MKEQTTIEFDGTVRELRASGFYHVKLDNGHEVLARKNGKMSKHDRSAQPWQSAN